MSRCARRPSFVDAADPNRVIIIQGHLDSRNSTNENITDDAPGANSTMRWFKASPTTTFPAALTAIVIGRPSPANGRTVVVLVATSSLKTCLSKKSLT